MDLHIHTTFSDGSETPETIVDMAADSGLTLIAITDHDTIGGLERAERQAVNRGIRLLRGIEISADYADLSVHILGLGIKNTNDSFIAILRKITDGRASRNPRIVQKLNELGLALSMEEIRDIAAGDIISRPHIAEAMVRNGYVTTIDEAFSAFLNRGQPAYQDRYRPSVSEATAMIRSTGGVSILAHPGLLRFSSTPGLLEFHLRHLQSSGIEGVETHYPSHSLFVKRRLSDIAQKLNLLESGGSDFHGQFKSNRLGLGTADQPITGDFLEPLLERLGLPAGVVQPAGDTA
jgi:3',5'-nucleoside bisphosphate phosphatase